MDLSLLKNQVIDLFYRDKISTAFVKEVKGKRLLVLLPTGKEEAISHSALVSLGLKAPEGLDLSSILELLREKNKLREELKATFNLQELWEVVKGEIHFCPPSYLAELYLNRKPTADEECAFIRAILEERLYFRFKTWEEVEVLSEEEVKGILQQKEKEREKEHLRAEFRYFISYLLEDKASGLPPEREAIFLQMLREFVVFEEGTSLGRDLLSVLNEFNLASPSKVFEVLVRRCYLREDENLELERYGFPLNFSSKALNQMEEILATSLEDLPFLERYEDLTHLQTFAVDSEETQDVDDALSVVENDGEWIIYVHIADVSSFIPPHSPLFVTALKRAGTLYLPDEIIPMFPFELSHGRFSLLEGELRSALTFKISLGLPFTLSSFEIKPSLIRVKKRFTYEEVDGFIAQRDPFWHSLYLLLMEHKKKREEQGALAIILPEVQVKVSKDGKITIKKIEMTPARDLISELMILTNHLSAKFCAHQGIPIIYRKQKEPFQIFPEAKDSWYFRILQLKNLAKSELSLDPGFHSGLGLEFYTTLTSPIRRCLDLIIHYQLMNFLLKPEVPFKAEELQGLIPELEENLKRVQLIKTKRVRYFLLKYLAQNYHNIPLEGVVIEKRERLLKVYLPEFNLTGEVRGNFSQVGPGDWVKVNLVRIDPRAELLLLEICS